MEKKYIKPIIIEEELVIEDIIAASYGENVPGDVYENFPF